MKLSGLILRYLFTGAALWLVTSSCQKVIDLKVNNAQPQLVIEGDFSSTLGRQVVKISRSVPFSSSNTFPPVSGAVVTINNNNGNIYKFVEDTAGSYAAKSLRGLPGRTYTLTVQVDGKVYTASSTMPSPVPLDSLGSEEDSFNKDRRNVIVFYQDPAGVVNRYRFVMYVNGVEVKNIFANDDNFTDGRYVQQLLFQNATPIHAGDRVTVDMQSVDQNVFAYWFSLRQQQADNPGGGTAPSNPPSNISNNALGYFSAHTSQKISFNTR